MKLTLPQQDVYFEQLLYPNEPIYNIGAKIRIEGAINIEGFKDAYQSLIAQHDAYRTFFLKHEEDIIVSISEDYSTELELMDFSNHKNPDKTANEFMQKEFMQPFDILSGSFLHQFILIKVSNDLHYLFSVYHHIITDGWGTALMFQRLVKNYNEILEFGKITSTYPFSYKDFVTDDKAYQESESYDDDKTYWVEKFKSLPENLFEKIDPTNRHNRSSRKSFFIKRETYNKLNELAKKYQSSTFHLILALLYLYFGRKHQNRDFAIGLPVLNRGKSIFKKTVGLFMGVSPLRIQLNFDHTFQNLVTTIKTQLRQDYRHQRFPLGKLIQELQVFQEKEKLFNITLSYEKQNYANNFGDTKTTVIPLTHQSERVALAVYIREFDENEDVKIDFDYNLNYFNEETIFLVVQHFQKFINEVIKHPNKKLFDLNYLTEDEKRKIIVDFNNTNTQYPKDKTFLDVFHKQVQLYPRNIAVKDSNTSLSYLELHDLSNTIAQHILNQEKEITSVGVLLERSVNTIAVLLGILKSGKSYIPLDPTFPYKRLQYIIDHSELKLLISDRGIEDKKFQNSTILNLEDVLEKANQIQEVTPAKIKATDTAYIIYTSGSTGNPKGVEISHQSLLNFLLSMQKKPGIKDSDTLFAVTTYAFDISILEFFAPLISGASVYIASNETLADPQKTIEVIQRVNPSILQATPSFYQLLFNAGWNGYRKLKVLCGGDLLSEDLAEQLLESCGQLWNMYGPTETTIWSSVKQITLAKESSNIGSPIANTQLYILDENKQILSINSNGILYIAGDGLAKGYFKDLQLTAQKFIPNPLGKGEIYNTNDLAKWNDKGEVIFLGRNDNQIKIRGYRIELGDIETQLNLIPQIQKAIVVAKKQQGQDSFLIAYIIKEDKDYDLQQCIPILERQLPKYMIPYTLIKVDEFPLTPNKKIDRKALTQKSIQISTNAEVNEFASTPLQKQLEKYWKEVLQYENNIALTDHFFTLGGHSLNAVKLTHLINTELHYTIGLKTIFDYPTIQSLSDHLSTMKLNKINAITFVSSKEHYPLTPSQHDLWLASQYPQKSIAYNMVASFEVKGKIYEDKINKVVCQLIAKHEILRTNFIEKEGKVFQKIIPINDVSFNISLVKSNKNRVEGIIKRYVNTQFDLQGDLLIKMMLIQTSTNTSILVFCTHHIIMDGISLEYITKEFSENYNNPELLVKNGKQNIQFKDYAEWLSKNIDSKASSFFWKNYLANYTIKESVTTDFNRSNENYNGKYFNADFTAKETKAIKLFTQEQKSTVHNVLATLLNVLIFKIYNHKDIIIGTVNSGRTMPDIYAMIGMFVKTLPLRTKLSERMSFLEVLTQVQKNMTLIDEYQDFPIKHKKGILFDILMTFQNPDFSYQETIKTSGVTLEHLPIETDYSRLPMLFNFFEVNKKLKATISYDTGKYEDATIKFIVIMLKRLLNKIIKSPLVKLSELDDSLVITGQQEKINFDFNF